ncbi:MAG: GNAT family N-acetyltransferase [Candidatus Methylomirabilales bacterium]
MRRGKAIFIKPPRRPAQLEMVWPEERLGTPPELHIPHGFRLRTYGLGDDETLSCLLDRAGMGRARLDYRIPHVLPDGFFFVQHEGTGRLVATCVAAHLPTLRHPFGGNLGWLAVDPNYRGQGLGYAVSAAVTQRLLKAGYRHIYLETDDFRLPAIKIYLRMGWIPFVFQEDMHDRWQAVCQQLGWVFSPECWPCILNSPVGGVRPV